MDIYKTFTLIAHSLFIIFLASLVFLLFSSDLYADGQLYNGVQTYFVSPNGNDAGPGTSKDPLATPVELVERVKNYVKLNSERADGVLLGGVYGYWNLGEDVRLKIHDLNCKATNPCEFRSEGKKKAMLLGYPRYVNPYKKPYHPSLTFGPLIEKLGTKFTETFAYNLISIAESSYVIVRGLRVEGARYGNITIGGNTATHHILLDRIDSRDALLKNLIISSYDTHHIYVHNSRFVGQFNYGPATHLVYIQSAHFIPSHPPHHHMEFYNNEFSGAFRWPIQVTGRLHSLRVLSNIFHHSLLGALNLMGVRGAFIENNLIYGNNNRAIVFYQYFDTAYWDPEDPEDIKAWKATHWNNENIMVANNTIVQPEYAFTKLHGYEPQEHSAFHFVLSEQAKSFGMEDHRNIKLVNNIVYNHNGWFANAEGCSLNAPGNQFVNNLMYSPGKHPDILITNDGEDAYLDYFQSKYANWEGNSIGDPHFVSKKDLYIDTSQTSYLPWETLIPRHKKDLRNNYHIKKNSAAIDAGHLGYFPSFDLDANKRFKYRGPDAGAYEFMGSSGKGSFGNKQKKRKGKKRRRRRNREAGLR